MVSWFGIVLNSGVLFAEDDFAVKTRITHSANRKCSSNSILIGDIAMHRLNKLQLIRQIQIGITFSFLSKLQNVEFYYIVLQSNFVFLCVNFSNKNLLSTFDGI